MYIYIYITVLYVYLLKLFEYFRFQNSETIFFGCTPSFFFGPHYYYYSHNNNINIICTSARPVSY